MDEQTIEKSIVYLNDNGFCVFKGVPKDYITKTKINETIDNFLKIVKISQEEKLQLKVGLIKYLNQELNLKDVDE